MQDEKFLDLAKKTLDRLYLLFLNGKVQEAIKEAKKAHGKRKMLDFLRKIKDSFGVVGKFLDEHKISVEFGNFKFETEPSKKVSKSPCSFYFGFVLSLVTLDSFQVIHCEKVLRAKEFNN